jgi:hypothetical protein
LHQFKKALQKQIAAQPAIAGFYLKRPQLSNQLKILKLINFNTNEIFKN